MSRPIALVTGGSRGIGKAICEALADTHHILVGARSLDAAAPVVAGLPSAEPFVCELTDTEATQRLVSALDRLDVLVNSAGIAPMGAVADMSIQSWRDTFELNVIAVAALTQAALPALRAAHGQVVMINSGAGMVAGKNTSPYSASKFALRALTDALREEERGQIRVISVHPGRVDTDMQVSIQATLGRDYHPEQHLRAGSVAAAVVAALQASPEAMIESVSIRPVTS